MPSIAHFLALQRNTTLLLVMLMLAGTGERLWLGFAPKYIEWLGGGVVVIGLFDALQTLLGAIYAYPGGWITDRFGERRSLLLFNALSVSGYVVVLLWSHWLAVVLGALLFLCWSALSLPATFSVVATALDASRHTMGIGLQSMVRRVPMMIGPLIGGALINNHGWRDGIRYALLGAIVLGVMTAVFQWFMAEDLVQNASGTVRNTGNAGNTSARIETTVSFSAVLRSFTPALRELLISDILIRFCERIPYAFVVLWAMDHGRLNAQQFSWLIAIEMITAMLCYVPVAHLADKYGRRPFVLITFTFFTLFPVTLLWASNFASLAAAFAVRGLKEFGEPARKALIIGEARPDIRARTYGAYYLIRDCVVTTGSFLGAWLWHLSPMHNFLGAALCGAVGTAWFGRFVFRAKRLRTEN